MGWNLLASVFHWKGQPLHCFTCRTPVHPGLFLSEADREQVAMTGQVMYHYTCKCGQVALITHDCWEGSMTGEWLDMDIIKEANKDYLGEYGRKN